MCAKYLQKLFYEILNLKHVSTIVMHETSLLVDSAMGNSHLDYYSLFLGIL